MNFDEGEDPYEDLFSDWSQPARLTPLSMNASPAASVAQSPQRLELGSIAGEVIVEAANDSRLATKGPCSHPSYDAYVKHVKAQRYKTSQIWDNAKWTLNCVLKQKSKTYSGPIPAWVKNNLRSISAFREYYKGKRKPDNVTKVKTQDDLDQMWFLHEQLARQAPKKYAALGLNDPDFF
jgi:hypothetical protein